MTPKIRAGLATAGAVAGFLAAAFALWPELGWVTPNQHRADFDSTLSEITRFRDEWRCDELNEELIDLLEQVSGGDSSARTEERIRRIRDEIDELDCEQFNL